MLFSEVRLATPAVYLFFWNQKFFILFIYLFIFFFSFFLLKRKIFLLMYKSKVCLSDLKHFWILNSINFSQQSRAQSFCEPGSKRAVSFLPSLPPFTRLTVVLLLETSDENKTKKSFLFLNAFQAGSNFGRHSNHWICAIVNEFSFKIFSVESKFFSLLIRYKLGIFSCYGLRVSNIRKNNSTLN